MTDIQRYWPDIEGIGVRRAVMRPIPDDSHPDDEYVTYADHLAAIAAAREDALAAAVQRVEALDWAFIHSSGELITRAEAVLAIKGSTDVMTAIKGDQ